MKSLLEDLVCNQSLQPAEHKAAGNLLKQFLSDSLQSERCKVDLDALLTPVEVGAQHAIFRASIVMQPCFVAGPIPGELRHAIGHEHCRAVDLHRSPDLPLHQQRVSD